MHFKGFLILGRKKTSSAPEIVYFGQDGVEANQAAEEARKSGAFAALGRQISPHCTPLPIDPAETKVSGPPVERKREVHKVQLSSSKPKSIVPPPPPVAKIQPETETKINSPE